MQRRYYLLCWVVLIAFWAMTPPVFFGAKLAWDRQANRVEDWLPASFEETKQLFWFVERFGSDELLMVSWDGCNLQDTRLQRLSDQLRLPAMHQGEEVLWFKQVLSGPRMLEALSSEPLSLSKEEALARMEGWLLGPDGETTCLVAVASTIGSANRAAAVEHVLSTAEQVVKIPRDEIRLAGPTYDGVAIDQAAKGSLLWLNIWSWLICFVVLLACLRGFLLAWYVFAVAFVGEQMSLALMHYSGATLDSVLLLVANLTFVLGIAGGIHLISYIDDSRTRHDNLATAIANALRIALRPYSLAVGTTAVGLLSLSISQLNPIRLFGTFGAISVVVQLGLILTVLPAVIMILPPRKWRIDSRVSHLSYLSWLSSPVTRHAPVILASAVLLLILGGFGIWSLRTSVDVRKLFDSEAKVIRDYRWLESNIGYLVPMEIVLRWPTLNPDQPRRDREEELLRRFRLVSQLREDLRQVASVGAIITPATFAPPLPEGTATGFRQISARRALMARLLHSHEQLEETGLYLEHGNEELWRLSIRVSANQDLDYGEVLDEIATITSQTLARQPNPPGSLACGGIPVIYRTQSQLLSDLIVSFSVAVGMIALVMMIYLRGIVAGLSIMLPNVLPTAIVFGIMGWLGWEVEIGGVLTASVALGIAIDDSMHFVTCYYDALRRGLSRQSAIEEAYRICGNAMTQTTLVCVLGLIVFALSPFVPIARFAWLMFSLLSIALICDLIVLPAILAVLPHPRHLANSTENASTDQVPQTKEKHQQPRRSPESSGTS